MGSGDAATAAGTARADADGVIGNYHLLQKIGEGGMGEVWLAEQRKPVRRRVALKLVKAGMDSREVLARFDSERQALALMDHHVICKVFDAGSTPKDSPYFVMEYVAGVPITTYCDEHRLDTRARLELFIQVCEGVQHAHHKAIIHRDLKPSNILVHEVDGRPEPKIIDFGVAKALTLSQEAAFTRVGAMIGTPEYMSPEQATTSGEDIDTRSDVYSLGIIFYELLAGCPPLDFRGTALEEFLRKLREEDPPKPSVKIQKQSREFTTELARKQSTQPVALEKQLRGDLDAIALKALEKERARRYSAASDFAADIRRFLNNETVIAVPPSLGYRTRKFARRYRVALSATAAFILVLLGTTIISVRQSIRANREAAIAQAIDTFLERDVLSQASVFSQNGARPDPDLKVRTALDRAAAAIPGKFENAPEVEASVRQTIGYAYLSMGIYPEAHTQLQRALELYRKTAGVKAQKTLDAMNDLAFVLGNQSDNAGARALLTESLADANRYLGPETETALIASNYLGMLDLDSGKNEEASKLFEHNLDIRRRTLGPENFNTINTAALLARSYMGSGKVSEAETILATQADITRRAFGSEHPMTTRVLNLLAQLYLSESKYAQAESLLNEIITTQSKVNGPEQPGTLASMTALALVYAGEGRYAESEALHLKVLEIKRRVLGPENRQTLNSLTYVTRLYLEQSKYRQALPWAQQALAARRHAVGSDNAPAMDAAGDLAHVYVGLHEFALAEPLARESFNWYQQHRPDDSDRFFYSALLGASLAGQNRLAEGEPLLTSGYEGMLARQQNLQPDERYTLAHAQQWLTDSQRAQPQ